MIFRSSLACLSLIPSNRLKMQNRRYLKRNLPEVWLMGPFYWHRWCSQRSADTNRIFFSGIAFWMLKTVSTMRSSAFLPSPQTTGRLVKGPWWFWGIKLAMWNRQSLTGYCQSQNKRTQQWGRQFDRYHLSLTWASALFLSLPLKNFLRCFQVGRRLLPSIKKIHLLRSSQTRSFFLRGTASSPYFSLYYLSASILLILFCWIQATLCHAASTFSQNLTKTLMTLWYGRCWVLPCPYSCSMPYMRMLMLYSKGSLSREASKLVIFSCCSGLIFRVTKKFLMSGLVLILFIISFFFPLTLEILLDCSSSFQDEDDSDEELLERDLDRECLQPLTLLALLLPPLRHLPPLSSDDSSSSDSSTVGSYLSNYSFQTALPQPYRWHFLADLLKPGYGLGFISDSGISFSQSCS